MFQGCVSSTKTDFWSMVWQEQSRLIVMTTKEVERGKTKCARYWPELDQCDQFGQYDVTHVSEQSSKDYTLRQFLIQHREQPEEEPRKIFHFHFLGWPGT